MHMCMWMPRRVTEAVESWNLDDAFVGQITDTTRHTVDRAYQQLLGRYVGIL